MLGWIAFLLLGFIVLIVLGLRPRQAFLVVCAGVLFLWMMRVGFSMLIRSVTGIILLGVLLWLFIRVWNDSGRKR